MAEMNMLLTQEIPSARQALLDSHDSLKKVASYCAQKYIADANKTAALEETKQYTTQSLASVAYQINTLASNMLHMLDIQATQLSEMEDSVNNISQTVDIHKEKVARREIGLLTSNKIVLKDKAIVPPENPDRSVKYIRKAIDYTELDDIGHGVILSNHTNAERIHKASISSMPKRSPKLSAKLIQKHDSIRSNSSSHGTLRAVKAPTVPQEYTPNNQRLSSLFGARTNSSCSIDSTGQSLPSTDGMPPPPPTTYDSTVDGSSRASIKIRKPFLASDSNGGYSIPNAPTVAFPPPHVGNSTAESYATASVLDLPLPPPLQLLDQNNQEHFLSSSQVTEPVTPSDFGIPPPPPPNFPISATMLPPPPPPPDTASMVSSGAGSSVHGYAVEPDWVPKSYLEKMVVIYDYSANNPDELNLREDQIVYVVKKNDDGWFEGVLDGVTGLFPSNYAEPVSS